MRILFAVGAILALSASVPARAFTAGEIHRATETSSAAARNHGDATLRLLIWYPAEAAEAAVDVGPPDARIFTAGQVAADAPFVDAKPRPVILLSHGFGGSARQMTWLGTALARQGYVAVAVDHPGTNGVDGVNDEGAYAPWERAGDLEAALDYLLIDPDLSAHVDVKHVGVAGFSIGGFTSLLLAGARTDFPRFIQFCNGPRRDAICNPQQEYPLDFNSLPTVLARPQMKRFAIHEHDDFTDPRIKAAFLIAPAVVQALDPDSLAHIAVPIDIVLGDIDPVAPSPSNGEAAAKLIPGAQLTVLPGVGHYDFLSECGLAGQKQLTVLCKDGPGVSRAKTHAAAEAEALAFFDRTLRASH